MLSGVSWMLIRYPQRINQLKEINRQIKDKGVAIWTVGSDFFFFFLCVCGANQQIMLALPCKKCYTLREREREIMVASGGHSGDPQRFLRALRGSAEDLDCNPLLWSSLFGEIDTIRMFPKIFPYDVNEASSMLLFQNMWHINKFLDAIWQIFIPFLLDDVKR